MRPDEAGGGARTGRKHERHHGGHVIGRWLAGLEWSRVLARRLVWEARRGAVVGTDLGGSGLAREADVSTAALCGRPGKRKGGVG